MYHIHNCCYFSSARAPGAVRVLLRFWRHLLDEDLDGQMYCCEVDLAWRLDFAVPVQQCSERKPVGLVVSLEQGQPANVFQQLHAIGQPGRPLTPPSHGVRLPLPFAYLVASREWKTFVLLAVSSRRAWCFHACNQGAAVNASTSLHDTKREHRGQ